MKKVNNIDRKLDNMLSESIKLSNKPKQQLNEKRKNRIIITKNNKNE